MKKRASLLEVSMDQRHKIALNCKNCRLDLIVETYTNFAGTLDFFQWFLDLPCPRCGRTTSE